MRTWKKLAAVLLAIPAFVLALVCSAAPPEDSTCQSIDIDSVGRVLIRKAAIRSIATSHGLKGRADYVSLEPPSSEEFKGSHTVDHIFILADVRPMAAPRCNRLGDDEKNGTVSCGQSVPGDSGLKVIAKFRVGDGDDYRDDMSRTIDYVRKQALCAR